MVSSSSSSNGYVVFLACFATIGGFLFGYDIGIIGGVKDMDAFRREFDIPLLSTCTNESHSNVTDITKKCKDAETTLGLVVSTFSLGCLAGALLAGILSDKLGRRKSIIIGGIGFIVGGAIQSASVELWMIFFGRVVAGLGVGFVSMVVPIYNAEVSPKHLRGRLVSLNQLSITAGIMVSFLVNLGCVKFDAGWRISLGLQCLFALILVCGMMVLPESPRWLVQQGYDEKAKRVLYKLRYVEDSRVIQSEDAVAAAVEDEFGDIKETCENDKTLESTWLDLFRNGMWKRTFIGVGIQVFQQFTGMNVIMYYSTTVFHMVNVSKYVATAITGVTNFLATFIAIYLVDKTGRKVLLLLGSVGMAVSVFIAAGLLSPYGCSDGHISAATGYAVTFFVCLFVVNFAYGWGPTAWVVTSEIFPLRIRGKAVSVTTASNWIANFSIAMFTPLLLDCAVLGVKGTFVLMGVLLTLSFLFVLFTTPETKGKSLEHIDDLFQSQSWLEISDWKRYVSCGNLCSRKRHSSYEILESHELTSSSE
ncbi:uncharacterized protein [Oscarella lobularis]|uniref:uncharacterized protein n=1 Tax=Oscarella lobularis TaxID=121494 RepID=UPI003313C123